MEERRAFCPKPGHVYLLAPDAAPYECLASDIKSNAVLRHINTGWTMLVHGVGIYSNGRIDWAYSTDGHFSDGEDVCVSLLSHTDEE